MPNATVFEQINAQHDECFSPDIWAASCDKGPDDMTRDFE